MQTGQGHRHFLPVKSKKYHGNLSHYLLSSYGPFVTHTSRLSSCLCFGHTHTPPLTPPPKKKSLILLHVPDSVFVTTVSTLNLIPCNVGFNVNAIVLFLCVKHNFRWTPETETCPSAKLLESISLKSRGQNVKRRRKWQISSRFWDRWMFQFTGCVVFATAAEGRGHKKM